MYNLPNSIENDIFSLFIANLILLTVGIRITKGVVTVYPNRNNVLPTRFVINHYKTGFYYKTACNTAFFVYKKEDVYMLRVQSRTCSGSSTRFRMQNQRPCSCRLPIVTIQTDSDWINGIG